MLVRSVPFFRCYSGNGGISQRSSIHRLPSSRPKLPSSMSRRIGPVYARRSKTPSTPPVVPDEFQSEELEATVTTEERTKLEDDYIEAEEETEVNYFETHVSKPPTFPVNPPRYTEPTNSALPPWVWITVGILLAAVFNKVMNFVSRPQEAVTEMMMKQMMSQMGGGAQTGANPFAGMPNPAMSGMGGMAGANVQNSAASPPVDVTAQSTPAPTVHEPTQDQDTTTVPPASTPLANGANSASPPPPPAAPFFQDVSPSAKEGGGNAGTDEDPDEVVDFMFEMMKNPQMRESLYQFLPENMRNPETLETVMASPMVREQFKSIMTPEMLKQVKGFRGQMEDPQMKSQLESMNVSPDVLMQKIMNEPELCAMLQKPNIMSAVLDMQKDPSNMSKYVNDPEIMKFIAKMNELTLQAQMQSKTETTTN
eukprot:g6307.t1